MKTQFWMLPVAVMTMALALLWMPAGASAQDGFEPDNSHLQANVLANGELQTHTISPAGDVDYVRIEITGSGASSFRIVANNGTELTMADASLIPVGTWNIDSQGNTYIAFGYLASGVYYVQVFDQEGGEINGYQVSCTWSTPVADAYEPDDSLNAARRILNGQVQTHSFHAAGNKDWVKFTVDSYGAGDLYCRTIGDISVSHALYNRQGTMLRFDDVANNEETYKAYLAPGTYFVKAYATYGREVGNYTIRIRWVSGDVWEYDDIRSWAKEIRKGVIQRHNIGRTGDVDWVKFNVPAGGVRNVVLQTRKQGVAGNTELFLYNARRVRIAYDDDSGEGRFSRIRRASLPAGWYYAKVREKGNNARIRRYGLEVNWTDP